MGQKYFLSVTINTLNDFTISKIPDDFRLYCLKIITGTLLLACCKSSGLLIFAGNIRITIKN